MADAELKIESVKLRKATTSDQKKNAMEQVEKAKLRFNKARSEYGILPKLRETSVDGVTVVGSKTKKGGGSTGKRDAEG